MKKKILVILLAAILCGSVFASSSEANNGRWAGPTVAHLCQGIAVTYDLGAFDVDAQLGFPLVLNAPELIEDFSTEKLMKIFLTEEIKVGAYYSIINSGSLSLNLGASAMVFNSTSHYVPQTPSATDTEGWGGNVSIVFTPAVQLKLAFNNKFMIKVSATTGFMAITEGADSVIGWGFNVPYGNTNAQAGLVFYSVAAIAYDSVNISAQFKL